MNLKLTVRSNISETCTGASMTLRSVISLELIIIKKEKCNLVTDCQSILARWRNHFSQLFNVRGVNDVRKTTIHTAEPLMPGPNAFEFEKATEKLKCHKSPGIDQMPAEYLKAGGRTILSEIHNNLIWNKKEFPEEWKELVIVPIYKKGDKTDCSNYRGIILLLTTYKILSNILLSRLTPYVEEIIWDDQCGF